MKGCFTVLLIFASTGMVYAQQSQNDFSPQQSGVLPQSNSTSRTNQTRLAALQSDSRVDSDSDNHVILPDDFDFPQDSGRQRPFFGPENNPVVRNTNTRNDNTRNTRNTRNAAVEQPRFSAQSSERSATSVLPPRNNRAQNTNYQNARNGNAQATNLRNVSSQSRPVSSIYDLHVTPALQDELKQYGYLFAKLNTNEASSDQVRLFGDSQRARSGNGESKIFSSKISNYRGNLVIDIDDDALQRIEQGSYTLDDFDRYDARGVVLRYVSRNNQKVDLNRVDLGQTDKYSNPAQDFDRRNVVNNRQPDRGFSDSNLEYRNRPDRDRPDRNRDSDGFFVLPNSARSERGAVRDLGATRTLGGRDSRDSRYRTSSIRRSYQDRMGDIYRDDTVRTRDRMVDRRYDDVTYNDRPATAAPRRDVIDDDQRALKEGFAELSQWQRDLVRETREIQEQRRQLERLDLKADSYTFNDLNRVRYETAKNQTRQYRTGDLGRDMRHDLRTPVVSDRYADSRNSNPNNYASLNLGSYATLAPPLADPNDPRFASYAKNNLDQVARLNQKFAAMQQANELAALENKVDIEYQKQQLKHAQAKLKNENKTARSYIDDGAVIGSLGANMAAGRGGYAGDRYAANVGNSNRNNRGVADLSMRSDRTNSYNDNRQQTASPGASDKLVRALWFIALLSIGMNMYLALLARSFYSRYNELADELRETFTSSSVDYSPPSRSSRPSRPRRDLENVNPIPQRAT